MAARPVRCVPATTRTGTPLGSTRSTDSPPSVSGSGRASAAGCVCQAQDVGLVLPPGRRHPTNRDRGPRRMITHGVPASVPRSCSSSSVRSAVANPNALANASARARSGFSNSSQAMSVHLDHRIPRPPGVLTLAGALLAVQVVMGANRVAHAPSPSLTDEIVTYDATLSQEFLTKSSKVNLSVIVEWREPSRTGPRQPPRAAQAAHPRGTDRGGADASSRQES